jgi:hypothetical protein
VVEQRVPPEFKPYVLANDLQALAAAAQERPALEDVLPTMAMPCLLLVGEADARYPAVQECAKHLLHACAEGADCASSSPELIFCVFCSAGEQTPSTQPGRRRP